MFGEIIHLQNLTLMPISSVSNCYNDDGTPGKGAASSKWSGKSPFFPFLLFILDSWVVRGPLEWSSVGYKQPVSSGIAATP